MERDLMSGEKDALRRFADALKDETLRQKLLEDIEIARVFPWNEDGSMMGFNLDGYTRPGEVKQYLYEPEGEALDKDGAKLSLLLFSDRNDRLYKLDVIRWDDKPLIEPDWNTVKVHTSSPARDG